MKQTQLNQNEQELIEKAKVFTEFLTSLKDCCQKSKFLNERKLQYAIIFSLKIIGEGLASRNIPSSLKSCPQLKERADDLYKLREALIYTYLLAQPKEVSFKNFLAELWERIIHKNDEIKTLHKQLKGLLNEMDGDVKAIYKPTRYFKQFENTILSTLPKKQANKNTFLEIFKDEIQFIQATAANTAIKDIIKNPVDHYALQNSLEIIGTLIKKFGVKSFNKFCNSISDQDLKMFLKDLRQLRNDTIHDLIVNSQTLASLIQHAPALQSALETYKDALTTTTEENVEQITQQTETLSLQPLIDPHNAPNPYPQTYYPFYWGPTTYTDYSNIYPPPVYDQPYPVYSKVPEPMVPPPKTSRPMQAESSEFVPGSQSVNNPYAFFQPAPATPPNAIQIQQTAPSQSKEDEDDENLPHPPSPGNKSEKDDN